MKTLLVTKSDYPIYVNPESLDVTDVYFAREAISRIVRIEEDCLVKSEDKVVEAKSGDILIIFYERLFPNRFVIVKSNEWLENLDTYEKKMAESRDAKSNEVLSEPCCDECDAESAA